MAKVSTLSLSLSDAGTSLAPDLPTVTAACSFSCRYAQQIKTILTATLGVALSLCRFVVSLSLLLVYVCSINKTCQLVIAVPRRCLRARVVLGLQLVIVMAIEIGRNKSVFRDGRVDIREGGGGGDI